MFFNDEELEVAQVIKAYGFGWTPSVGHYILDQGGLIECASPFQDRVFFILDIKHFLRRAGTIENLKQHACWLPTWEQARIILRECFVSDEAVSRRLSETRAIEQQTERLELYRMIEDQITGKLST